MHQSVVTGGVSAIGEADAEDDGEEDTGTGTGEIADGVGLGGSPWQAVRRTVSQRARTREA